MSNPAMPVRYKCPVCAALHFPTRCKDRSKYGVCGCCWAIEWMAVEPEIR